MVRPPSSEWFFLDAAERALTGSVLGAALGTGIGAVFAINPGIGAVVGAESGAVLGAAIGALLVGLADNFGKALFPEVSYFTLYAPMVLILAIKPTGLFGRE